jgi:cysteine desulfurase/selenocysteine lyase
MKALKSQFPIFNTNPTLAYFDSASTSLTPQPVLEKMNEYYTKYGANIHRGLYDISAKASHEYEHARQVVADFINADRDEIIFTYGTTHGLNMLAQSLSKNLTQGDNIVLTVWEHHANLIPWQQVAKGKQIELRFITLTDDYQLDLDHAKTLIDANTKIVSFGHVSNVLGTIAPAKELIALAKEVGATTIVDGAQSVVHMKTDVKDLGVDFLVFSGHKLYGPTGIGVLYGKKEKLAQLEPVFFGGDMVLDVSYTDASWSAVPSRFEPGTPNIEGAIGLGAAVDFIQRIGLENIAKHEDSVTNYLIDQLTQLEAVHIVGPNTSQQRAPAISFTIDGIHPHDIAEICNRHNVAIRAGDHCAMPLMKKLCIAGTARFSIGMHTDTNDIGKAVTALKDAITIFS